VGGDAGWRGIGLDISDAMISGRARWMRPPRQCGLQVRAVGGHRPSGATSISFVPDPAGTGSTSRRRPGRGLSPAEVGWPARRCSDEFQSEPQRRGGPPASLFAATIEWWSAISWGFASNADDLSAPGLPSSKSLPVRCRRAYTHEAARRIRASAGVRPAGSGRRHAFDREARRCWHAFRRSRWPCANRVLAIVARKNPSQAATARRTPNATAKTYAERRRIA